MPRCPGHILATLPRTSCHVAQEIFWPRCPGHHATLPRTSSGHVALDIMPRCPGHLLAVLPCSLPEVEELLKGWGYEVWWSKVNTRHHGLPQNRSRMYLVGVFAELKACDFVWPDPVEPISLRALLDRGASGVPAPKNKTVLDNIEWGLGELESAGVNSETTYSLIDVHASKSRRQVMTDVCPCLTRHRCLLNGYFLTRRKNMLATEDRVDV